MISSPPCCAPPSPLAVGDRDAFLRDVAAALCGQELGDGAVYRTIAQVQRKYFDAPIATAGYRPWWGALIPFPEPKASIDFVSRPAVWRHRETNAVGGSRHEPGDLVPPWQAD